MLYQVNWPTLFLVRLLDISMTYTEYLNIHNLKSVVLESVLVDKGPNDHDMTDSQHK